MTDAKKPYTLSIDIDSDVKKVLEMNAKQYDLTVSKFSRNLMLISLDDIEIMKKIGLLSACLAFKKLIETTTPLKIKNPYNELGEDARISMVIDYETKAILDAYALKLDIPLKKFARNLLYSAFDDYNFLKKTGLMRIAFIFKKQIEGHKEFDERLEKKS